MAAVAPSTVTEDLLAPRLGNPGGGEVARILTEAVTLVALAFEDAWKDVPVEIVDECVYRVARGIKDATNKASNGAGQVTVGDAQPLRAPADPLTSAYPIIRRYVVLGL